jgi:hypothetical protein
MSLVLIDDSDLVVKYNTPGGWIEDGLFPEFNQTSHASATQGDTATLVFEGTSALSFRQYFTKACNPTPRDVH